MHFTIDRPLFLHILYKLWGEWSGKNDKSYRINYTNKTVTFEGGGGRVGNPCVPKLWQFICSVRGWIRILRLLPTVMIHSDTKQQSLLKRGFKLCPIGWRNCLASHYRMTMDCLLCIRIHRHCDDSILMAFVGKRRNPKPQVLQSKKRRPMMNSQTNAASQTNQQEKQELGVPRDNCVRLHISFHNLNSQTRVVTTQSNVTHCRWMKYHTPAKEVIKRQDIHDGLCCNLKSGRGSCIDSISWERTCALRALWGLQSSGNTGGRGVCWLFNAVGVTQTLGTWWCNLNLYTSCI